MSKKLLFVLIILSCKPSNNGKEILISENLKHVLSSYSETYRIGKVRSTDKELVFAHPSYHIFFDQLGSDTILSIRSLPHLSKNNPINYRNEGDSLYTYTQVNPNGFFWSNGHPVIIFDADNYSQGFINKGSLNPTIPDSLQFDLSKENAHLNSQPEYFKISKKKLYRIDWNMIHEANKE